MESLLLIPISGFRGTIKVLYCGICHTDLHIIKNYWGNAMYPVVPG